MVEIGAECTSSAKLSVAMLGVAEKLRELDKAR
jgi:hypothetical protein